MFHRMVRRVGVVHGGGVKGLEHTLEDEMWWVGVVHGVGVVHCVGVVHGVGNERMDHFDSQT